MVILITGGAGFIGTHLCRILRKQNHRVRVLDLNKPNVSIDGVEYHRGDARRVEDVSKVISGVDAVYHFAAVVSVPVCQDIPFDSTVTNTLSTLVVLEELKKEQQRTKNPVLFFFSSSSVVYGDLGKEDKPLSEVEKLETPLSFYGAQKLSSEFFIRQYCKSSGVRALCLRLFNVYGEGQDPSSPYSGVITRFLGALEKGTPLKLNAGGFQTRDFITVEDVASAFAAGLNADHHKMDGRALNVGSGTSITIRFLAETMVELGRKFKKSTPQILETEARQGDVAYSRADISEAKDILKWNPQIKLELGLSQLIANFKTN